MKPVKIENITKNPVIDLSLDTIKIGKQGLVFVNTKRGAEKTAEDIAKKTDLKSDALNKLSGDILNALSRPTKQCERLAFCIKKGTAFHHAGLVAKQRELIEDNFRQGLIKIICATPTLCISKNSKIWCGISETEVSKLNSSNSLFVLSKNNLIFMKAQKVQKIKNSSNLIKITSVSGYSIKVTPNHKLLTKKGNSKNLIEARNVKVKDKIATIGGLNLSRSNTPSIKNFVIDNPLPISNRKFNSVLYYFVGAMLGDGYSGAETLHNSIIYKGSPSIVGADEEVFIITRGVCKELGLNCRKSVMSSGTPQLVLGKNKWFREFLCRCGIERGQNKYISPKLMSGNLENVASLLRGLFDTDGYVEKSGNVGFSNISSKLIEQIRKLLLRFGIVCKVRVREKGEMKIYEKSYATLPHWELNIFNKICILTFYRHIGFSIKRKQTNLKKLVKKIESNINYVSCNKCSYKVYKDVFSGRTKDQRKWAPIKLKVIRLLGRKGEISSRNLRKLVRHEPRKNETRLNHHYEFIKKRRIGNRSKTEWFWSLNEIGGWIYQNILEKRKGIEDFLALDNCPVCENPLMRNIKKGWKDADFEEDIYWDVIKEIKSVPAEEEVYNVVLSDNPVNDHMFVANGFIIHNSYGLDLPAFRAIIRDLKRYTIHGYTWIPVLEYLQQSGRAGRPKFDKHGESIAIASTKPEKEEIINRYLYGKPEEIYSKLAVEPVLRTYVLSLIATGFARDKKELFEFFEKTFWAHQYRDMRALEAIVEKILGMLREFEFINENKQDFVSADALKEERITATILGRRVSELYIDPLTAHHLINHLRSATSGRIKPFSFLQMISSTLEMRPLLRARMKEYDELQEAIFRYGDYLLQKEPPLYEPGYDDFLNSVKTALFFEDWINEKDEEHLLERFNIRPGEIRVKLALADWLLYASEELAKLLQFQSLVKELMKLRFRLKYGVREELLPLLKLKEIGRVRARKLYNNQIKDIGDVKKAGLIVLSQLLGKQTAINIKKQVGQDATRQEGKQKISLMGYDEAGSN